MNKYFLFLFSLSFLSLSCYKANNNQADDTETKILVLASIHSSHKNNPNYSFEKLFEIIDNYRPDIIGIEIRPEDLNEPIEYLQNNYPPDMLKIKERYSTKKIVLGFDWLGESLEGKSIPENWWDKMSPIKKLEREFYKDSSANAVNIKDKMKLYEDRQTELIKNAGALELNSQYDGITGELYDKFKILTKGTKYEALSDFYTARDKNIDKNIIEAIKKNKGKRLLFTLGADHKVFALAEIRKELGKSVELVDLKNIISSE